MKVGSILVDGGIACVVVGLVLAVTVRGRHQPMLLALFCLANLTAATGNMIMDSWWLGTGNLIAASCFASLWWRADQDRRHGGPAWLREAMAADARKRAARERGHDDAAA